MADENGNGSWKRWGSIGAILLLLLTFLGYIYQAGQWQAKADERQTRTELDIAKIQSDLRTDYVRTDVLTPKLDAIQESLKELKAQQKELNELLIGQQQQRRKGPS